MTILYYDDMHNTYVHHSWTDIKNFKWSIDSVTRGAQIVIRKCRFNMTCTACPLEVAIGETEDNSTLTTALYTERRKQDAYHVTVSSQTSNKTYIIYPPRLVKCSYSIIYVMHHLMIYIN